MRMKFEGCWYEYGIVLPIGIRHVYKALPDLFDYQAENGLSDLFKTLLARHYQKLLELDEHVDWYTKKIHSLSQHEACQRLQPISGVGPMIASARYQHIGNGGE